MVSDEQLTSITRVAFHDAVEAALEAEEIRTAVRDRDVEPEVLRERLWQAESEVLALASESQQTLRQALAAEGAAKEEFRQRHRRGVLLTVSLVNVMAALVLAVVFVQGLAASLTSWRSWVAVLAGQVGLPSAIAAVSSLVIAVLIATAQSTRLTDRVRDELRLSDLEGQVEEAEETLSAAVRAGVLPTARSLIADLARPDAIWQLSVRNAPGLAEFQSDDFDIPTAGSKELNRLVGTMRGAPSESRVREE